ncbi:Lipid A export ATP-binding/permease protein MsbA OS=Photorhabdus luminescens subsp, laumondii (strain TT01) GN=msbA PE=3 SV=1 [Rhizoctonia solani AG-1 IB]|uniref:Lipid A export ATP-binding/permease protein MsbA n=1 Tax=Thanatephorus cucumeris (strain AG1-IB / isolate 7/3/14) TaxID=1108050 RepID=A0A0B7FCT3_THACB|nr:Lipid A export ATP-binding/permease protein MsbA OS=Photorhabdus luminescens subsp, laumondii (strain TT01) GN=msbA PE=3 SV=1 [Rhizoctonia solani AG-1 IB]
MKKILDVHCHLDISKAEDASTKSYLKRVTTQSSNAWSILQNLAEVASVISEVIGIAAMMRPLLASFKGVNIFVWVCLLHPFLSQLNQASIYKSFYAIVTNPHWLRMEALFKLGTSHEYKKEVLGGGLENYLKTEYAKSMTKLGNSCVKDPGDQMENRQLLGWDDLNAVFGSIPMLFYAWRAIKGETDFSLASLVMMQRIIEAVHSVSWDIISKGRNMVKLLKNLATLYEVLEVKTSFVDGQTIYPDDNHLEKKGMAIEFKAVVFKYPSTSKEVIKDMSFKINSGQLCVIVGENGSGKSTTINLITRLYDINSGDILVDGRSVRDYNISSLRNAANIMYQDYRHLPLTVYDEAHLAYYSSYSLKIIRLETIYK